MFKFLLKRKLPNVFTFVFLFAFVFFIFSQIWNFFQPGVFKINLFHFFIFPFIGFKNSLAIILFLFAISGFISVFLETKIFDKFLNFYTKKYSKKIFLFFAFFIVFISFLGSTMGFGEEMIPFSPIIMIICFSLGYNLFLVLLLTVFSAGIGTIFSTLNPFVYIASIQALKINKTEEIIYSFLWWKYLVWFLMTVFLVILLFLYKKNFKPTTVLKLESSLEKKIFFLDKLRFFLFFLFFFSALFIIFFSNRFSFFPLQIENNSDYKLFFASGIVVLGSFIINLFKPNNAKEIYLKNFFIGVKDITVVCFIIASISGLTWLISESKFIEKINNSALGNFFQNQRKQGNFFFNLFKVLIIFFCMLFFSIVFTSSSGLATFFFGFAGSFLVNLEPNWISFYIFLFSMANGFANLFSPWGAILSGILNILKLDHQEFIIITKNLLLKIFFAIIGVVVITFVLLYYGVLY